MPNTKLYDRKNVAVRSTDQGQTAVAFASKLATHKWSVGAGGSDDLSSTLAQYPSVVELGRPLQVNIFEESPATNLQVEKVVPTGKYWRLIGGMLAFNASANVATRAPVITIEDTDSTVIETVTLSTKTTGQIENDHFLFGTELNVSGNLGVAAKGTLSIDEPVTAGDTFTIGDFLYTFIADGSQSTVANGIDMGADEAATKVNMNAIFVDGNHPDVNAVAFTGGGANDDMVFTARSPGLTVGTAIVFIENTLTHSSNVLDGSGTLGGTTEGVHNADVLGTLDYPTLGVLMVPTDKIVINLGAAHDDDVYDLSIFGLEFDNDPR